MVKSQAPMTKSNLVNHKKRRAALKTQAALEEGSHNISQHRTQGEGQKNRKLLISMPKDGRPMVGAIWFCRSPIRMPHTVPAIVPRKVLPSPRVLCHPERSGPMSKGMPPRRALRSCWGYRRARHQPEGDNQDIHYSYSDCSSRSRPYIQII